MMFIERPDIENIVDAMINERLQEIVTGLEMKAEMYRANHNWSAAAVIDEIKSAIEQEENQ